MGRKSLKEPRQKEIIIAFYELAKKEGLENASIAKTAQEIDMQPSLIMHYFKTKEALIYGLVEYILDKYLLIFEIKGKQKLSSIQVLTQVIERLFSHKWNALFDDSVSYSCYSLTFRDRVIQEKYRNVLNALREQLEILIANCKANKEIKVADPATTADLIFVLVDGAYYYLSLISDKKQYNKHLKIYKNQAIDLLQIL